jgi:hypothetical protein
MVIIPIYYNTESTKTLNDLGIEYNLSDCDIRDVIFLHINVIGRYIEDDIEGTTIYANGREFISPLKINEVRKLIEIVY